MNSTPRPPDERFRRQRLSERLRAAFLAGAEEDSRRRLGRGPTREELERVLRRYPGDVRSRCDPILAESTPSQATLPFHGGESRLIGSVDVSTATRPLTPRRTAWSMRLRELRNLVG